MKLKPLYNKVAVVRIKNPTETASGIILTKGVGDVDKARVIALGPDVKEVQEGNAVLVDWNKASMSMFGDIPVYMVSEDDIVGVFE